MSLAQLRLTDKLDRTIENAFELVVIFTEDIFDGKIVIVLDPAADLLDDKPDPFGFPNTLVKMGHTFVATKNSSAKISLKSEDGLIMEGVSEVSAHILY